MLTSIKLENLHIFLGNSTIHIILRKTSLAMSNFRNIGIGFLWPDNIRIIFDNTGKCFVKNGRKSFENLLSKVLNSSYYPESLRPLVSYDLIAPKRDFVYLHARHVLSCGHMHGPLKGASSGVFLCLAMETLVKDTKWFVERRTKHNQSIMVFAGHDKKPDKKPPDFFHVTNIISFHPDHPWPKALIWLIYSISAPLE